MLGNFVIGLREGLEAAIVVSILIAYLIKIGRREQVAAVWTGVSLAIVACLIFAALIDLTSTKLPAKFEPAFTGTVSLLAVAGVTWMIFWMRKVSATISGELRAKVDEALVVGTSAMITLAFIAVAREGFETAIFIWSAIKATGDTAIPIIGAALGLATSVVLGYLLYKRTVKINLSVFFRWTGAFLIIVAAGVLSAAVHEFQEIGWLPGAENLAFDVSSTINPNSWYGALLEGTINFNAKTTVLQVVVWVCFVASVTFAYFRPMSAANPASSASSASSSDSPDSPAKSPKAVKS